MVKNKNKKALSKTEGAFLFLPYIYLRDTKQIKSEVNNMTFQVQLNVQFLDDTALLELVGDSRWFDYPENLIEAYLGMKLEHNLISNLVGFRFSNSLIKFREDYLEEIENDLDKFNAGCFDEVVYYDSYIEHYQKHSKSS
jgi:hypothetical protein